MAVMKTEDELDDILSSALDDFDDDEIPADLNDSNRDVIDANTASKAVEMTESMQKLMSDVQNPAFQSSLEDTFRQLSAGGGSEGLEKLMNPEVTQNPERATGSDVDKGVAQTLDMLAKASKDMEGMEASQNEEMGEEIMKEMMKEFEKMGEKEDFQNVVDGMLKQLMSKEVMYDPMKQICDKYPEWLATNQAELSKEDYERYGKQYQYFQKITAVYETEPDNYSRLMELMQDMQECGQPPAELVKELAPGLNFDGEGMPILPNMGPGMMPGNFNLPGVAEGENCVIS